MQAVNIHFGKTADVHKMVEFDIDGKISLDISEDGINSRGWTIIPATNPVVRTCKLCLSVSTLLKNASNIHWLRQLQTPRKHGTACCIRQDCFFNKVISSAVD